MVCLCSRTPRFHHVFSSCRIRYQTESKTHFKLITGLQKSKSHNNYSRKGLDIKTITSEITSLPIHQPTHLPKHTSPILNRKHSKLENEYDLKERWLFSLSLRKYNLLKTVCQQGLLRLSSLNLLRKSRYPSISGSEKKNFPIREALKMQVESGETKIKADIRESKQE